MMRRQNNKLVIDFNLLAVLRFTFCMMRTEDLLTQQTLSKETCRWYILTRFSSIFTKTTNRRRTIRSAHDFKLI